MSNNNNKVNITFSFPTPPSSSPLPIPYDASTLKPTPLEPQQYQPAKKEIPLDDAKSNLDKLAAAVKVGDSAVINEQFYATASAILTGLDQQGTDLKKWLDLASMLNDMNSTDLLSSSNSSLLTRLRAKLKTLILDCSVSEWSPWSPCDASGAMTQKRSIIARPTNGGTACPTLTQSSNCPVACTVGQWSDFGACSQTCGGGTHKQTRAILSPALFGGSCLPLSNVEACNSNACPIDCVLSPYSSWSPCSNGITTRTRIIVTDAKFGGSNCDAELTQRSNCPLDCIVGPWSTWSPCDAKGSMTHSRTVTIPPLYGGAQCPVLTESSNCPVPCGVSEWSPYGPCSAVCGGGTQARTRIIAVNPLYGGAACPDLQNQQSCNSNACPLDCVTGPWSAWSPCSNGSTRRTMPIIKPAAFGGTECPVASLLTQDSNCPLDCAVGPWSSWAACSSNGSTSRTRPVLVPAAYGGISCPNLSELSNCPVDCVTGPWSTCSATCGGGTQTRSVTLPAANGGLACPALTMACNSNVCPVNCIGSWGNFGACSKTCGSGTQSQTYAVSIPAANGGTACPVANNATNTQTCNPQACPGITMKVDGRAPFNVPCNPGDYRCQAQKVCETISGVSCLWQNYDCYTGSGGSYYPTGTPGSSSFNVTYAYNWGGNQAPGSYGNICSEDESYMARYGLAKTGTGAGWGHWNLV